MAKNARSAGSVEASDGYDEARSWAWLPLSVLARTGLASQGWLARRCWLASKVLAEYSNVGRSPWAENRRGITCRGDLQASRWTISTTCRPGAAGVSSGSLDPVSQARALEVGDPALEKEAWISSVLLEWGSCGKIVYVDGAPAGDMTYALPAYAPRSVAFPTSPVSADAVLLMTRTSCRNSPAVAGPDACPGSRQGPDAPRHQSH